eukprot:67506-Chlamydomonas_euryale.AAC.8
MENVLTRARKGTTQVTTCVMENGLVRARKGTTQVTTCVMENGLARARKGTTQVTTSRVLSKRLQLALALDLQLPWSYAAPAFCAWQRLAHLRSIACAVTFAHLT